MSSKVKDWTVLSMLEWGTAFFNNRDIPDPRLSIEWLLAETLNIKRLDLYLKFDRPLSPSELEELRPLVKRRAQHEPLQYIIGFTDFMNAHISVSPDVLIPRIETEQLVEIILDQHLASKKCSVLDIGTGSGCIPIALKMERSQWHVRGIDISSEALKVAEKNAQKNEVNVVFSEGDILNHQTINLEYSPNIIISNPPYILPEEKQTLQPQVKDYEPHQALFFDDLKNMYGSIILFAENNLAAGGSLYLELHEHQGPKILDLFNQKNWDARLLNDYNKTPRFVIAHLF